TFHKPAAENAIPSLVKSVPIPDNVPAIVRFVGHHHDGGIAFYAVEAVSDRAAETVQTFIFDRHQLWQASLQLGQQFPRVILAAVVHDNDFVGDVVQPQFEMEVFDGRADTPLLVAGRDHDRK